MNKATVPLTQLAEGSKATIASIDAGSGARDHLINLGLTTGTKITLLKKGGPGPHLILLNETRLALGHGMAEKIMVHVRQS
ncbi:MAG: FeoA family protein [Candidatus Auribacterota bacterium]|jgi:ferrous iron transport protein A|nr:FeoA family protein [Candidatus Auribacterota bacterium]